VSDELYTGPSVLAPGASDTGRRLAGKLLVPLSVLFFIVVLLFYVLFTAITVRGRSMEPALLDGDRIFLTKTYEKPRRGDIVVFKALDQANREEDLVKRVIAIPGDMIEIRQGIALVNGEVEKTRGILTSPYDATYVSPTVVPAGHVFVLGDNRPIALDSRGLGPVPTFSIKGKAVYVFSPVTRIRRLP